MASAWVGRAGIAVAVHLALFGWIAARADEAQNRTLAGAFNASGHDLFGRFAGSPGNIVFSPYSIGTAMAMVLTGARSDTATEMVKVLRQRLDRDAMDAANAGMLAILNGYDKSATPPTCPDAMTLAGSQCESPKRPDGGCPFPARPQGERCVASPNAPPSASLRVANALMLTKAGADRVSADYATRLREDYAAEIFRNAGLDDVNAWVNRKTEGKIDRILDTLDPAAALVLIDAVYFKAAWASPFRAAATSEADFSLSASDMVKVPTMHQRGYFQVVAQPGLRAIRLPYGIKALSMMVVVPEAVDGATALAQRLGAPELAKLFAAFDPQTVTYTDLALPRFKTSFRAQLAEPFRQLGMTRPFDARRADFSGITGRPKEAAPLAIDQIVHRAVIDVTEEGTEAAAATAVVAVRAASMPPKSQPFTVDRPFLFYIADDATGAILFAGRISDPRKAS